MFLEGPVSVCTWYWKQVCRLKFYSAYYFHAELNCWKVYFLSIHTNCHLVCIYFWFLSAVPSGRKYCMRNNSFLIYTFSCSLLRLDINCSTIKCSFELSISSKFRDTWIFSNLDCNVSLIASAVLAFTYDVTFWF